MDPLALSKNGGSNVLGTPFVPALVEVAGAATESSPLSATPVTHEGIIFANPQAMSLLTEPVLNNHPF